MAIGTILSIHSDRFSHFWVFFYCNNFKGRGESIYMDGNEISNEAGKTYSNYNWDQTGAEISHLITSIYIFFKGMLAGRLIMEYVFFFFQ